MPLLLSPQELRTDMQVYYPVVHAQRVLLPAGRLLTSADVANLRRNYPDLQVSVVDAMLDERVPFADDARNHEVARKAQRDLFRALSGVKDRFAGQMAVNAGDVRQLESAVGEVVRFIRENPVTAAVLARHSASQHYLTTHSTNVFYLSLVLGNAVRRCVQECAALGSKRLGRQRRSCLDLTPLGLAALFQDLSLWQVADLYTTCSPLTAQQRSLIRNHPIASANALPDGVPEATRVAVRMHHENHDGSGYPHGLMGEEIHLFGRILRICDAFDAGTAATVYAPPKSPVRALAEMTMGRYARLYDPLLLRLFSRLVQPFPIGAKIRLGCRRYAVVVRYGQTDPFRPVVVVAFDRDGHRLPASAVEGPYAMEKHPELSVYSFRGEDLSDIYSADLDLAEPLVLEDFRNIMESAYP